MIACLIDVLLALPEELVDARFDRKVNEHQRLCMRVRSLFCFLSAEIEFWDYYSRYFACLILNDIVNSAHLYLVSPQMYFGRLYLLAICQTRIRRDYVAIFACNEVTRVRARARQTMYFKTKIDAKVRYQHRHASCYRRCSFQ